MAAAADRSPTDGAGDVHREIAAGITVVERRATGRISPDETLYLAVR